MFVNKLHRRIRGTVLVALVGSCACTAPPTPNSTAALNRQAPEGWALSGRDAAVYRVDIDEKMQRRDVSSATLLSTQATTDQFALLAQQVDATPYRGTRVRLSGYLRSVDILGRAFLWMRVDTNSFSAVAFDDMHGRAVRGTTRWKVYEVILDIPMDATIIAMGAGIVGTGQIWLNDVLLELVDDEFPSTDRQLPHTTLDQAAQQQFWEQALDLPAVAPSTASD
jgi:hypothetical protein